ncbi:MAG: ABC transporter ATP-binding protein [Coriobacteriales bacterium]|jgi:heme exporter protein A|nr:ABC transporter ATP-binding protein [Coriobacteriales bacterium]
MKTSVAKTASNSIAADQDAPAIFVKKLSKAFGARKALDNVSFSLPRGSFLTIFGHNGAGKSTLLRILATLARSSGGNAEVLGYNLVQNPESLRAHIGLISHKSMLYLDLTAEENLLIAARLYGVGAMNDGDSSCADFARGNNSDCAARVNNLLSAVGLTSRRHDVVRGFSRGMTQRLAIARALIHNPRLVLLDEPYSGLDPNAVVVLDKLIAEVRESDNKRTFCMVSHDLQKGLQMATHVLILERGRVALFGERASLGDDNISKCYYASLGIQDDSAKFKDIMARPQDTPANLKGDFARPKDTSAKPKDTSPQANLSAMPNDTSVQGNLSANNDALARSTSQQNQGKEALR